MNIIVLYGILIAIGMSIGGTGVHYWEHYQVLSMEKQIADQKLEASQQLTTLTNKANEEILTNINLNSERDKSYEQNIKTINFLHDTINSVRLREPTSRKNSNCTATNSTSTGIVETETGDTGFSTRLHEFLKPRTFAADKISIYAAECYNFIVERNCGITK